MGIFNLFGDTSVSVIIANVIIGLMSFLIIAYIYNKVEKHTNKENCLSIVSIIIGCLLNGLTYALICEVNMTAAQIYNYLAVSIFILITKKHRRLLLASIGFVLTSLVHALKVVAAILLSFLLSLIDPSKNEIIYYTIWLLITLLLAFVLFRIKRFKNGFRFLDNSKHLGIGLIVSGIVFILTCINYDKDSASNLFLVTILVGIVISGVGLYLWIRHSITTRYREHLQSQSEEHFKEQLEERDKEIEKQRQSNEFLAKIVHRDNHLMNSLNTAIDAYQNADDNAEKSDLFHEIQTMIKERGELIDREQRDTKLLPSTGSLLIDSTINDLYIKAAAHGIDFDMAASAPVSEIIGKYISQTDLQTLLSDHIKDAVIAVEARGEGSGKILLDLSMQNDNYCITIYDNGVAFEIDTLSKLGRERVTTHADSGGSGIGFMTTFETLNKAYASLIITEFDSTMPFTKSVAFRFDGESNFIIQSHRSEELKEKLTRDDVVIL